VGDQRSRQVDTLLQAVGEGGDGTIGDGFEIEEADDGGRPPRGFERLATRERETEDLADETGSGRRRSAPSRRCRGPTAP